ncbi:S-adenosyl-L-methionine-dependent methyltransferase [Wilcoxina mikolae CBS 423.85]|nr:S-adenosyl-L-methionine-dependent methyltransferase [Wilcoxina mikolae CBS 423.85]
MASKQDIEVDPLVLEDPENESYGSGAKGESSTASLTSSVNEYFHENGRRYHAYFGTDKNLQPTDETEQDRLDLHHEIFLLLLSGSLHAAPFSSTPHRILDVGTGTGIWPVDMADKYPSAEVIGVDLSPIQPAWIPPNCKFEVDDAENPWTYAPNSFDLIHMRNLAQSIIDWPSLLSKAYTCTKPGGFTELCELGMIAHSDDNSIPEDCGCQSGWSTSVMR